MRGRLALIDALRGMAAIWVVMEHFWDRVTLPWEPGPIGWVFDHGYLGVPIFFVLSGYVIALNLSAQPVNAHMIGRFALRRAIRLDPPYWVSIAAALALAVAATWIGIEKEFPTLAQLIAHLVYAQELLGYGHIIAVYWTLCLEFQFYLFLALLLCGRRWLSETAFHSAFLALLALSVVQYLQIIDVSPRGFFLPYWWAFALGALTCWANTGALALPWYAVGVVLVLPAAFGARTAFVCVTVATALLLYTAGVLRRMHWLSAQPWQFLGRISYSLYLFHPVVGWSAMSLALRYLPDELALLAGIAVSIVSAYIAYLTVERPSINLSRKIALA